MDPQMMQRILSRQGAPDTPDNQNRISTFAGSNPDVMDRYGMGLPPGLDDNSALLRLSLDKSIAKADGEPPPGRVEVGQPQMAPNQRPQAATPAPGPRPQMGPNPQAPQYGYPQPGGTGQGGATLPGVNPIDVRGAEAGGQGEPGGWAKGVDAAITPGSGGWLDQLLPAILGVSAAGRLAPRGGTSIQPPMQALPAPQLQLPAPQQRLAAPQPQIPDAGTPKYPSGAPEITRATGQSPEDVARLQAEVAAENEQGARALQDQLRKQNAQRDTGDLVKRAGRAVGRK